LPESALPEPAEFESVSADPIADGAASSDPDPSGHVSEVAQDLQQILLGAAGVEEFLGEVAQRAARTVTGVLACGVTVQATPRSRPLGATSDEFARRMDEIQYDVDDGPCLTCLREGAVVVVADVATDARWPAFSRRGRAEGARSSLSVPLRLQGRAIGALNLYSREPQALSEEDLARASRFADQAAGAVAIALRLADREEHSRHLEAALTSRSTIDQALGILMGQRRITANQAFDVLRRLSQRANVKLRDIAAALIADVTADGPRPDPQSGRGLSQP
jgi:GAF domain-containing protein